MKYYLFLDECGDQNLGNFNPDFPIFTLCGVIVSEIENEKIISEINKIKSEFWKDKKIIFHSRDIRKCQNGFEVLFDLDCKKRFYERINSVLGNSNYTIVSCCVLKEEYIRKYGKLSDVYAISLSFIIERTVFFLDKEKINKRSPIELSVVAECRGKKEDNNLLNYYNKLLDRGTHFVKSDRIKEYFTSFKFKDKREDIAGLQISDLVAYPITRYVLDKEAFNVSFEIIKNKIYAQNGRMHGLKIHPDQSIKKKKELQCNPFPNGDTPIQLSSNHLEDGDNSH